MIPVEKPAALPKANALDPRRDSVAEPELLNPAPVAQGEGRLTLTPLEALSASLSQHGIPYDSVALDSSRAYYELAQQACRVARSLKAELAELVKARAKTQRLYDELAGPGGEWEGLRRERDALRADLSLARDQRDEALNDKAQVEKERDSLKAEVERLKSELVSLALKRHETCDAEIEGLKAEVDALKKELAAQRSENEILQADCHDGGCRACASCCDDMEARAEAAEDAQVKGVAAALREAVTLRKLLAESEAKLVEARKGEHPSGFGWRQEVDALRADLARETVRANAAELRLEEMEAKDERRSEPAWAYQLLDAQPSWPHDMLGGLVKVVAHYERGTQSIDGRVVATAIAKAKGLPPPTREYEEEQPSSDAEHRLRLIRDFVSLIAGGEK